MSKKSSAIIKMKDSAEDLRVHKEDLFDLPMRLLVIGRSQLSGKTNLVGNLMLRPYGKEDDHIGQQLYRYDFRGNNIYIVCPSTVVDDKWQAIIDGKKIPDGNIYHSYDEDELDALYDRLSEQYDREKAEGKKPEQKLVIMDDVSWSGDLKGKLHGVINKFACNGRHRLISWIITSQKLSDVATTLRENMTGAIIYSCSQKQLELFYNDVGMCPKTEFCKAFREVTNKRHTFMVINYSNPHDKMFMDSDFNPIPALSK